MIKRVNGMCDCYHLYSELVKLEVQDLKELLNLPLVNHGQSLRGSKFVELLERAFQISNVKKHLEFRGNQEDKIYREQIRKQKKYSHLVNENKEFLSEFCDPLLMKMSDSRLKSITGTQFNLPIVKWFYNQDTHELMLIRDLEDMSKNLIRLFGVFELKLLHPSYIRFLSNEKFESVSSESAENDKNYFVKTINLMANVMEKIQLRKALKHAQLARLNIGEIQAARIDPKGNLEIKTNRRKYVFSTRLDIAGLNQDSLNQLNATEILVREGVPPNAEEMATKFKGYIKWAIEECKNLPEKPMFNIKEEPEPESEED